MLRPRQPPQSSHWLRRLRQLRYAWYNPLWCGLTSFHGYSWSVENLLHLVPLSPTWWCLLPPPSHNGRILSFPTETIYSLTVCVGLQRSIRLGGNRSGITASSWSEVGLIVGASGSGNGQKGGNNISGIDRRKYFSSGHDFFWHFELYIKNYLTPISSPHNFTPLFLHVTSPHSLAPQ